MSKIKNKAKKGRFATVGAIATTIDFGILFWLSSLGMASIAANFISTTAAFCFSFIANRHFAFRATDGHVGKQIGLFVAVTLCGIWVLQPPLIFLGEKVIKTYFSLPGWLVLLIGKLIASGATLVWNYYMYSRLVFKKDT